MHPLLKIISRRLISKGVLPDTIPTYMRDVANIYLSNTHQSTPEMNRRLNTLGWNDFDLDDQTLQQIVAVVETHDLNTFRNFRLFTARCARGAKGAELIFSFGLPLR